MVLQIPRNSNKEHQPAGGTKDASPFMPDELNLESLPIFDEPTDVTPLFDKTYQMMEKLSSTHIGQYLLKRGDLVLRTFEETAKWRLPADNPEFYLMRPLPWIPFLLLIIVLRLLLMYLSIGALLVGDGPVTTKKFIYFIQTRRRKLRSIRMHGLKKIQQREAWNKAKNGVGQTAGIMARLGTLFGNVVCRPQSYNEDETAIVITRNFGTPETNKPNRDSPEPATSKSLRLENSPFLTCTEMLNKYANQDSDDDSDYTPAQEDEDSVNDESYTSVSSSNDTHVYKLDTSDENAKDLSPTEKSQSKSSNSPRQTSMPIIEIKPENEKKISDCTKNVDNNDENNMESVPAESDKSFTMSSKAAHTQHSPLNKGDTNNGGLAAAVEVVQVHEVEKPQNALFVNLLNGHGDVQKKSTPGHETAAHSKPHLPPPLLGNVTNAIPNIVEMLLDANADCLANQNEIPTYIPTTTNTIPVQIPIQTTSPTSAPLWSGASPSCSTTSSNSSLASFMTSEDNYGDVDRSDPPTPTPSLNATSSSEDIFQSPFGSPPDFSPISQVSTESPLLRSNGTEVHSNGNHAVDNEELISNSKHFKPNPEEKSSNTKQQQQKYQQRYRNRNRR